jgi:hypothetical protein
LNCHACFPLHHHHVLFIAAGYAAIVRYNSSSPARPGRTLPTPAHATDSEEESEEVMNMPRMNTPACFPPFDAAAQVSRHDCHLHAADKAINSEYCHAVAARRFTEWSASIPPSYSSAIRNHVPAIEIPTLARNVRE